MPDRWIVIPNWDRFQHRDAIRSKAEGIQAWVKDYTAQLHDDDWHNLTLAERGLLQTLRLEYAASQGRLPGDPPTLSRRLGLRVRDEHIAALNEAGFLEIVLEQPSKLVPHRREVEVEKEQTLLSSNGSTDTRPEEDDDDIDLGNLVQTAMVKDLA